MIYANFIVLQDNYGKNDKECEAKIKALYNTLKLEQLFKVNIYIYTFADIYIIEKSKNIGNLLLDLCQYHIPFSRYIRIKFWRILLHSYRNWYFMGLCFRPGGFLCGQRVRSRVLFRATRVWFASLAHNTNKDILGL